MRHTCFDEWHTEASHSAYKITRLELVFSRTSNLLYSDLVIKYIYQGVLLNGGGQFRKQQVAKRKQIGQINLSYLLFILEKTV